MTADAARPLPLPLARSTATAVLNMLFQPIVDLRDHAVVGFEALARGPVGSAWEQPRELFEQARAEGRLREMDWACRVAAVRDVRACAPSGPGWRLFVNSEPEVLGAICPEDLLADWVGGTGELEIVVEVTERALVHGPRRLLAAIDELRSFGCEIALDDVGANEASVALLPLIEPDVVKLDARVLRPPLGSLAGATLRAVASYLDRSGAFLLAEGIETEEDYARAKFLGAEWGQGYLFSRPRRLHAQDVDAAPPRPRAPGRRRADDSVSLERPWRAEPRLEVTSEWVSEHLSWVCESALPDAAMNVLLVRLPDPSIAPPGFVEALDALQKTCALSVVVLGDGAGPALASASGLDGTVALLIGPSVAHCMVARRVGDDRYEVALARNGSEVVAAAKELLAYAL